MANSKLNEILARYAAEIETLVRDDVTAKVLVSLSGQALGRASEHQRGARGPARKGEKRSAEVLEFLTEKLRAYIGKHPGERIEQIAIGMDVTTRELNLSVKKLLSAKRISTKGQKRSTSYFPKA